MTDLERVRRAISDAKDEMWNGLVEAIDAHLKEDAERDAFEHRLSLSLQKERNDAEAELARLREEAQQLSDEANMTDLERVMLEGSHAELLEACNAHLKEDVLLCDERDRLREELDRHHHDSCIQELQDMVTEVQTLANDANARAFKLEARLKDAIAEQATIRGMEAEARYTELLEAARGVEPLLLDHGWVRQEAQKAIDRLRQLIEEET